MSRRYSLSLSAEDWVLIGYLAGILVWWIAETMQTEPSDTSRSWTDQEIMLGEDHLQRLESGESVSIERWHGHELVLDGTVYVQAEVEDAEEETDDA